MEAEINGVYYKLKERKPPKKQSKMIMMASIMAQMTPFYYPGMGRGETRTGYHAPSEWLIEEFKLIQDKKSKLGRRDRDLVETSFKHHFEIKPQP